MKHIQNKKITQNPIVDLQHLRRHSSKVFALRTRIQNAMRFLWKILTEKTCSFVVLMVQRKQKHSTVFFFKKYKFSCIFMFLALCERYFFPTPD